MIGLTFANGLRSMLRHDPDIMMVGEIRDVETAEIILSHYKITRKRLTCEEIEHSFEIFFTELIKK